MDSLASFARRAFELGVKLQESGGCFQKLAYEMELTTGRLALYNQNSFDETFDLAYIPEAVRIGETHFGAEHFDGPQVCLCSLLQILHSAVMLEHSSFHG